ncbi:hypothetical protein SESBI_11985 [Sesbania bispinosa]|nr:hypothetical protein SESBI_11985 [Sesbania bispinosa]
MSPNKCMSLCLVLLLGMVLLATTSLADLQNRRLLSAEESVADGWKHHGHKPPKKHWPPTTQNEPSKVDQTIPQTQEEHTDGHKYKPPHKPWKKHPPSGN